MKLYLTSYRIPKIERLFQLIGKPADQISIAVIPNAKDYFAELARSVKINDALEFIRPYNVRRDIIDLRKEREPAILQSKLQMYDALWVLGGNTFNLRLEMQRSGFDSIINNVLQSNITYIGESAGTCVAGLNLKGVEKADNPLFAAEALYEGLSLVPGVLVPHADSTYYKDAIDYTRNLHSAKPGYYEINDNQALLVHDETNELITDELPTAV